jgi:hypothetical protein
MPVYDCENFKNGIFPRCCPNLGSEILKGFVEHIAYLDEATKHQVKLKYEEWDNSWCLHSQARRSYETFKKETVFHLTGREHKLLHFKWLAGRVFVQVNHQAARSNIRGWERSLVQEFVKGDKQVVEFVKDTFGFDVRDLKWGETANARRIRPDDSDWFEVHLSESPIKLTDQANKLVLEVQRAIMAREFLEKSEFEDFAKYLDECIADNQSRLKELLLIREVSIHTDPEDLPNSLLNSTADECELRLAPFAKPYEKWLEDRPGDESTVRGKEEETS